MTMPALTAQSTAAHMHEVATGTHAARTRVYSERDGDYIKGSPNTVVTTHNHISSLSSAYSRASPAVFTMGPAAYQYDAAEAGPRRSTDGVR